MSPYTHSEQAASLQVPKGFPVPLHCRIVQLTGSVFRSFWKSADWALPVGSSSSGAAAQPPSTIAEKPNTIIHFDILFVASSRATSALETG